MIVDTIFAGSDRNSNCILNSILASTSFFFKIELSFSHTGKVQNDSLTINTQGKRGLIFIVSNVKSLSLPMKIENFDDNVIASLKLYISLLALLTACFE